MATDEININYTGAQLDEVCRKTLTPNILSSGLESDYKFPTSGDMPINVNNIVPITATITNDTGFELHDFGGGDTAFRLKTDSVGGCYNLGISASITTSGNNVITEFGILVDGILQPGASVQRKVGTGTDVGAFAVTAIVDLNPGSRVDFFARVDVLSNIIFTKFGFNLVEVN